MDMLIIRRPINEIHRDRLVAGLTGSIGSGKTEASLILKESGFTVLHADLMAAEVLGSGDIKKDLLSLFGSGIYGEDGSIKKSVIAQQVFSNPEKRIRLNSLIHPAVRARFAQAARNLKKGEILLYDIPLLFETEGEKEFDVIISILAPFSVRMERVSRRNQMEPEDFRRRDLTQTPQDEKFLKSDAVILNDGNRDDFRKSVNLLGMILRESIRDQQK